VSNFILNFHNWSHPFDLGFLYFPQNKNITGQYVTNKIKDKVKTSRSYVE